ncbi:MAG: leucine-rich repeat protein [Clostridia bacterium]|nr:leucine-rich repeat protein [Clostridia bacterium]
MKNKVFIVILVFVLVALGVGLAVYFTRDGAQAHTVIFLDYYDQVIDTQKVSNGGNAVAPEVKQIEDLVFLRWNGDYRNITSDVTLKAIYGQVFDSDNSESSWRLSEYNKTDYGIVNEYCAAWNGKGIRYLTFPYFVEKYERNINAVGYYVIQGGKGRSAIRVQTEESQIEKVNIPYGVVEIYENAFCGCSGLTELSLPETLRVIGNDAFADTALTSIMLPSKLESIGINFLGSGTSKIELCFGDNGVVKEAEKFIIDGVCLYSKDGKTLITCYDKSVTSYTLLDGTETVLERAFCNSALERVDLNGASEIDANAFDGCNALIEVTGTEKLTTIGSNAFSDCGKLTVCDLTAVVSIDEYAFMHTGFEKVFIPMSAISIGEGAFSPVYGGKSALFYVEATERQEGWTLDWNGGGTIRYGSSYESFTENQKPIVSFYAVLNEQSILLESLKKSFSYGSVVEFPTAIEINEFMKGDYATGFWFYYVDGEKASVVGTVIATEDCAYYIELTESDKIFGYKYDSGGYYISAGENFSMLSSSDSIVIPDTYNGFDVVGIADYAFQGITGYSKLVLGKNISQIGVYAFENCGLSEIVFNGVIKIIKSSAFYGNSFTSLTIPDSVTSLGIRVFQSNKLLTSVTLGNGIVKLTNSAFFDCVELKSVKLGTYVTEIADYCFYGCVKLVTLTNDVALLKVGSNAFEGCTLFERLSSISKLTSIGEKAFYGCTSLGIVSLSMQTLSKIGTEVFAKGVTVIVDFSEKNTPSGWTRKWEGGAKVIYEEDVEPE